MQDESQALWRACSEGHCDVAVMLVEKGASVDAANEVSVHELWVVAALRGRGWCDVGRVADARWCCCMQDGCQPLHYACEDGHCDVATMLVEKGAPVDAANEVSLHELWVVAAVRGRGWCDVGRWLMRDGAAMCSIRGSPCTLHARVATATWPRCWWRSEQVWMLPTRCVFRRAVGIVGTVGGDSSAGQGRVARHGDVGRVADVSCCCDVQEGNQPLHLAWEDEHWDVVKMLVEKGAPVNTADEVSVHEGSGYRGG